MPYYLRPWAVSDKIIPGIPVRHQPNMRGVLDLGAYALIESPITIASGVVDLGKSLSSGLVESRRTLARALGLDEKALDSAPDLARAIVLMLELRGKPLMPGLDLKNKLYLNRQQVSESEVKPGVSENWPSVKARLQQNYRATAEAMRAKALGGLLYKYPNTVERDFIPDDLPLITAVKPRTTISDDFSGDLSAWTNLEGTFAIAAGRAYSDTQGGAPNYIGSMKHNTSLSIDDFWAEANAFAATGYAPQMLVRVQDLNNFYAPAYVNTATQLYIFKLIAGVYTSLDGPDVYAGGNGTLCRSVVNGSTLTSEVGGSTIGGPVTDMDLSGQLVAGLAFNGNGAHDGWLDNFQASDGVAADSSSSSSSSESTATSVSSSSSSSSSTVAESTSSSSSSSSTTATSQSSSSSTETSVSSLSSVTTSSSSSTIARSTSSSSTSSTVAETTSSSSSSMTSSSSSGDLTTSSSSTSSSSSTVAEFTSSSSTSTTQTSSSSTTATTGSSLTSSSSTSTSSSVAESTSTSSSSSGVLTSSSSSSSSTETTATSETTSSSTSSESETSSSSTSTNSSETTSSFSSQSDLTSSSSSTTITSSSSSSSSSSESSVSTSSSSEDDTGTTVTIYWTDPANISTALDDTPGYVRVYHNSGDPAKPYPNYDAIRASVIAGVEQWTSGPLADGTWAFGLRVWDGQYEELNTHTFVIFRVVNGDVLDDFPPKPVLLGNAAAGGTVSLMAMVNGISALSEPATIKFFTNDGAGGAVDYSTALDEIDVIPQANKFIAVMRTAAYGETERMFGAIAYDADGNPSLSASEIAVTPDATAPEAVPAISISGTRV